MLACCTDKGFLLLYLLEQDINGEMGLSLYEHKGLRPSNDSQESVPALRLSLKNVLQMPEGMLSLCCVRDELLVTSKDGLLHFFSWENSETERLMILYALQNTSDEFLVVEYRINFSNTVQVSDWYSNKIHVEIKCPSIDKKTNKKNTLDYGHSICDGFTTESWQFVR